MIPLASPDISDADIAAVVRVLRSGSLVQGEEVAALESELAAIVGTQHAVAVSSGTAALHAALVSLGAGPGRVVVVPSYSWIATANSAAVTGAEVHFVDVDPESYSMDVEILASDLDALARAGRRVAAVVPVHPFGNMAAIDNIVDLAEERAVPVLEDAACALGAVKDGRSAGAFGSAGCFSFHPMKPVTTGEGGFVSTDDATLAAAVREFRDHGQARSEGTRRFASIGLNYRLTDVLAALGRSQIARLDDLLSERRSIATRYGRGLTEMAEVERTPEVSERTTCQAYVVELSPWLDRDRLVAELRSRGVSAGAGTIAMPFTQPYRDAVDLNRFPVARRLSRSTLSLPMYNGLSSADVDRVLEALAESIPITKGIGNPS